VSADDEHPRLGAHPRAAGEDRVEDVERELVVGKEHQVEREPRLTAHRPHVRQRVGRGDRAEGFRIVDERRDDISREHEVAPVRHADNGRIVGERMIDNDVRAHVSRSDRMTR
jgi:hypothetical protein